MRLIAVLLLCSTALAQQSFNLPVPVEGAIADGDSVAGPAYFFIFPTQVNSGEVLVACASGDAGSLPWTVSSTPAETWNHTSVTASGAAHVQLWYTTATSTASYTVQLAFTGGNTASLSGSHYLHISGTLDGSIATQTASGTPATIATTQTTTANNDLLVHCGAPESVSSGMMPQTPMQFVAADSSSNRVYQFATNTGALGSQTATIKNASQTAGGTGLSPNLVMQTAAFKPSGMSLADTSLPDAASGVAYEAQLHCIGGTAGQTYSLFSGTFPTGISLNTATGEITGSSTVQGTSTLGFRCTDGTLTSATDTLTLKLGAAFNNPSLRQQQLRLNATVGNTFSSPVQCGSVIGVVMHGPNSHGGVGWVLNDSGATNSVKDANGNILHRIALNGGDTVAPLTAYVSDPINYSGTATININTTGHGGALMSTFFEVAGAQAVMKPATFDNVLGPNSSPVSFNMANSYTSVVPNELVLGVTASGRDHDTYSASAPFALIAQGGGTCQVGFDCMAFSDTNLVSASSATLTTNITTDFPNDNASQVLLSLRPGLPATGCVVAPTGPQGEKYRRQVW